MEDNRWTPDVDVALFRALHGHKPVGELRYDTPSIDRSAVKSLRVCVIARYEGLNKHWHMACIQQRLAQSLGASFTADDIWERLRGLYDLDALVSHAAICSYPTDMSAL